MALTFAKNLWLQLETELASQSSLYGISSCRVPVNQLTFASMSSMLCWVLTYLMLFKAEWLGNRPLLYVFVSFFGPDGAQRAHSLRTKSKGMCKVKELPT